MTMLYRKQRRDWFRRFNDDNFDLNDKKRENRFRKVEDCQLQALLDEDDTQSQKMLAENAKTHAKFLSDKKESHSCIRL